MIKIIIFCNFCLSLWIECPLIVYGSFELVYWASRYEEILNGKVTKNSSSRDYYYKDANNKIHLVDTEDHVNDEEMAEENVAKAVVTVYV